MPLNAPDINELRSIVDWVNLTEDVRELSIKFGDVELSISRDGGTSNGQHNAAQQPPATAASAAAPAPVAAAAEPVPAAAPVPPTVEASSDDALAPDEVLIKAPMVGVFYASPKPGAPAFVAEGDMVGADTVLGIVEVMKLMNNIQARVEGVVVKVLVKNEQAVEYGQPLMVIKRNG
jgi:acetyl-CoA carboxylase biotin carboxyl carrier protein